MRLSFRRPIPATLNAIAFAWLLAACGLSFEECGSGGSCASRIEFRGHTYQGASAAGLQIDSADLTQIGTASGGEPSLATNVVYALDNIDPADLVVMQLRDGEPEDYLLYSSGPVEFTDELCAYYANPPAECSTTN